MPTYSIKSVLSDTWGFFRNYAQVFAMIVFPIVIPLELLGFLARSIAPGETTTLLFSVVNLIAFPIYTIGLVLFCGSVLKGPTISVQEAWKSGVRYWPRYALMSLVMVVALVLLGVGLLVPVNLLFGGGQNAMLPVLLSIIVVVMMLCVMVRFSFSTFILLFENASATEAVKQSWEKTKPHFWLLAIGFVIITFILALLSTGFIGLLTTIGLSEAVSQGIYQILYPVISSVYTIYALRVYDLSNK